MSITRIATALLATSLAAASVAGADEAAACPTAAPQRSWRGPGGTVLPFRCDEQALDFLRTARVVGSKVLTSGTTRPSKLTLERDGVRAHAIFRHVDLVKHGVRLRDGSFQPTFRDSWKNDVAAYELARLLGSDAVPPTVPRSLDGQAGAVQLWIEGARRAVEYRAVLGRDSQRILRFAQASHDMQVFDALVANTDRNLGNMLVDDDGRLWWIDHTRAFALRFDDGSAPAIVEPSYLARLRSLEPEALGDQLRPWLGAFEIETLLKRRERLLRLAERPRLAAGDTGSALPN